MEMTHYLREHIEEHIAGRMLGNVITGKILALSAETAPFCVSLQKFWPKTDVQILAYPFTDYLGNDPGGRIQVTLDSPALPRELDSKFLAECFLCVVGCNDALDNGQNFLHAQAAALHVPLILGLLPENMEDPETSPLNRLNGVLNFTRIYAAEEYETWLVSSEGKMFKPEETEKLGEHIDFLAAFGVYRGDAAAQVPESAPLSVPVRETLRETCGDREIEEILRKGELSYKFMVDPFSPRLSFPFRKAVANDPPAHFMLSSDSLPVTIALRSPDEGFYLEPFMYGRNCIILSAENNDYFPVEMTWLDIPLENFARYMQERLADVSGPWGMIISGFFTKIPNRTYFLPVMLRQVWFEGGLISRIGMFCKCMCLPGLKEIAAFAPGHGVWTRAASICDSTVWNDWYATYENMQEGTIGVSPAPKNGLPVIYGPLGDHLPAPRSLDLPLLEAMLTEDMTTVRQCNALIEGEQHA